uniref:Uncharacterized protein n=1 Tax=Glossina brevipalpis TaxID=37001 RepID=A0A1A9WH80_9MUSC
MFNHHLSEMIPFAALLLMSSYATYKMPPEQYPYALTACFVAMVSSSLGILRGPEDPYSLVDQILISLMDFATLPLINIQIYLEANPLYAFIHAGSLIPLGIDMLVKIFGDERDHKAAESLKLANNIMNMASLTAIAIIDDNYLYFFVMLSYLMAQASLVHGRCKNYKWTESMHLLCFTLFFFVSSEAVTHKNVFTTKLFRDCEGPTINLAHLMLLEIISSSSSQRRL